MIVCVSRRRSEAGQTTGKKDGLFKGRIKMDSLNDILLERLKMRGIAPSTIPRFIKDLTGTLAFDPQSNLSEINRRMHLLGWYDVEVDEHTFQLVLATV
jgi:hypothetical protein